MNTEQVCGWYGELFLWSLIKFLHVFAIISFKFTSYPQDITQYLHAICIGGRGHYFVVDCYDTHSSGYIPWHVEIMWLSMTNMHLFYMYQNTTKFDLSAYFSGGIMMTSSNRNISALLALCAGEFPAQRPVTRSFDVFFDLRLNKQLSKQSWDAIAFIMTSV